MVVQSQRLPTRVVVLGTFVKKGYGTLTLEADNSALIGGVRVEKGTLAISQDASLGKSDAKLTLAGGILNVTNDVMLNREVSINTAASTIQTTSNVRYVFWQKNP